MPPILGYHGTESGGSEGFDHIRVDASTNCLPVLDFAHHKVHAGNHYSVIYSVADVGALAAPADMMTLSFKTSSTPFFHMRIGAYGEAGSQLYFIENKTGGGATPDGRIVSYNNRRGGTASTITDENGANAGEVGYNTTLFTGGTTLFDFYLNSNWLWTPTEWCLAKDQEYQAVLVEAGNVPATLILDWYEHTDLN